MARFLKTRHVKSSSDIESEIHNVGKLLYRATLGDEEIPKAKATPRPPPFIKLESVLLCTTAYSEYDLNMSILNMI